MSDLRDAALVEGEPRDGDAGGSAPSLNGERGLGDLRDPRPGQDRAVHALSPSTSGAPAIVHGAREQWLRRRREIIGASDWAAILGLDPRRGALSVFVDKVTDSETQERPWMRRGSRWEPVIAEEYHEATGRQVLEVPPYEIVIHPEHEFLGATLDRRTVTEDGAVIPLELKRVGRAHAHEWDDGATPIYYETQVMAQIACEGSALGAICALTSLDDEPEVRDLPRHERFLAAAIPKLEEFIWRVRRREPPPPDETPSTHDALRRLYPRDDGECVTLPEDALQLVEEWERAKDARNSATKDADRLGDRLRALIGSASLGDLADGSWLKLVATPRAGYTVEPSITRVLRHQRPKLPRRK